MKKHTVVFISVVAILLIVMVCVGVYVVLLNKTGIKKTGSENVFECVSSDICGYSVENGGETYRLVKADGGWSVENDEVAVLDAKKVDELIKSASGITANGRTADGSFEPENRGKIIIERNGGGKTELSFIGNAGDMCVFTLSGDSSRYTMYAASRDILMPALDSLRKLEIFGLPDGDTEEIDAYEFRENNGFVMSVRLKDDKELAEDGKNRYIMTEPSLCSVDDERFQQQIAVKLPQIKAEKFIDDFPDSLEKYGLDESSRSTLTIRCGDRTDTLYIGRVDGGLVYAMKEGENGVFAVNSSQLEFLGTEPFYIAEDGAATAEKLPAAGDGKAEK